jgi:hypothetical protein
MRAKIKGHWFCDNCDDVIFMSYQKTSETNVPCPDCGHLSCNFVPAKLTRKQLGELWFAAAKELVAAAETPELPTQFFEKPSEKI